MVKEKTYMYTPSLKEDGYQVYVRRSRYLSGGIKLELVDAEDNIPLLVATIEVPEELLDLDEVIIESGGKNDGVLKFLITNHIVTMPRRWTEIVINGENYPVCELINAL